MSLFLLVLLRSLLHLVITSVVGASGAIPVMCVCHCSNVLMCLLVLLVLLALVIVVGKLACYQHGHCQRC